MKKILCTALILVLLFTAVSGVVTAQGPTILIMVDVMEVFPDGRRNWVPNAEIAFYFENSRTTAFTDEHGGTDYFSAEQGNYSVRFIRAEGYQFLEAILYLNTDMEHIGVEYIFEPYISIGFDGLDFIFAVIDIFVISDDSAPPPTPASPSEISVELDGEQLEFDVPPMIVNDRTMVPFRAIFEALEMEVEWDDVNRVAIGENENFRIELPIGSYTAYVNGEPVALDSPAMIYGGRTLVPVRFIAEATGANVDWNPETQTVMISTTN